MQIRTMRPQEALEDIRGAAVILDIFRAGNTILSLLAAGAARVWLLADLERARSLKAGRPERLLVGERHRVPPPDFDGGNSPAAVPDLAPAGREAVLTTSAGTQAVHRLSAAQAVFFGTFAGASALAGAVARLAPESLTFVPMGLSGLEPAEEDDLAAFYLGGLARGRPPSFKTIRGRLLSCPAADHLRRLGAENDISFCTSLDTHQLVPAVDYSEDPPYCRAWAD